MLGHTSVSWTTQLATALQVLLYSRNEVDLGEEHQGVVMIGVVGVPPCLSLYLLTLNCTAALGWAASLSAGDGATATLPQSAPSRQNVKCQEIIMITISCFFCGAGYWY